MTAPKPPPDWGQVLVSAGNAALSQAVMLLGGTYAAAEQGLMQQVSENLQVAANVLRDIADRPAAVSKRQHR